MTSPRGTAGTGLTGPTAILNHAVKTQRLSVVDIHADGSRAGFYGTPPTSQEIAAGIEGRFFLSYDDDAFGEELRKFLAERFPERCRYESKSN